MPRFAGKQKAIVEEAPASVCLVSGEAVAKPQALAEEISTVRFFVFDEVFERRSSFLDAAARKQSVFSSRSRKRSSLTKLEQKQSLVSRSS
jgi:hypothetical protein